MSNSITDVIVHKLIKDSQQRVANVELRPAPLQVNEAVQKLIDGLYKLYAERVSKGFGRFEEDANEYPVQRYLQDHLAPQGESFFELSKKLMAHLQTRAAAESFATGGYVLVAKISSNGHNFLLCAIVTEVLGTAITERLDVVESMHLDMSQMRVAGRIDLTTWQAGGDRYISFLKGRSEVSGYFKLFLGCNDLQVPLAESKKLIDALESFAEQEGLELEARDGLFTVAHNYLTGLSKDGTPVELESFSNHVWPQAPASLQMVLVDPARSLSDGFVPDRRALKRLVRFEGRSQHWQLKFDRRALRSRDVEYDRKEDVLILRNLPRTLRDDLLSETPDDSE